MRSRRRVRASADAAQRGHRVGLAGQQPQLGADPRPADRAQRAAGDRGFAQLAGARLDGEPKPAGITRQPQQPGGVVDEAARRAALAAGGLRGRRALPRRVQHRPGSGPPSAIAIALTVKSRRRRSSSSAAGATSGSAPGRAYVSRARPSDVVSEAVELDRRGAEPVVDPGVAAERARSASTGRLRRPGRGRGGCPPQQQIADRAADHVDAVELGHELEQRLTGGERPNLREQTARRTESSPGQSSRIGPGDTRIPRSERD